MAQLLRRNWQESSEQRTKLAVLNIGNIYRKSILVTWILDYKHTYYVYIL